jgi:hypothetical protein
MSNTNKDKEFYEMADAFIALANKQGENAGMGKVSAAFLYAAARFNTYISASESSSASEYVANKEKSFDYFMSEYKKMLEEHFGDYAENFDQYLKNKNKNLH